MLKFIAVFIAFWMCFIFNLDQNILAWMKIPNSFATTALSALLICFCLRNSHNLVIGAGLFFCFIANIGISTAHTAYIPPTVAFTICITITLLPWLGSLSPDRNY